MKVIETADGKAYTWEEADDLARIEFERTILAGDSGRVVQGLMDALIAVLAKNTQETQEFWQRIRERILEIDPDFDPVQSENIKYDWAHHSFHPIKDKAKP